MEKGVLNYHLYKNFIICGPFLLTRNFSHLLPYRLHKCICIIMIFKVCLVSYLYRLCTHDNTNYDIIIIALQHNKVEDNNLHLLIKDYYY